MLAQVDWWTEAVKLGPVAALLAGAVYYLYRQSEVKNVERCDFLTKECETLKEEAKAREARHEEETRASIAKNEQTVEKLNALQIEYYETKLDLQTRITAVEAEAKGIAVGKKVMHDSVEIISKLSESVLEEVKRVTGD